MRLARCLSRLAVAAAGLAAIAGCPQEAQHAHPPTAADRDAWRDVPVAELESQRTFAALHRDVQPSPDGSNAQVWRLSGCKPETPASDCCVHQFVVRDARVASYEPQGPCIVGCGVWPKAKIYECLDKVRAESTPP